MLLNFKAEAKSLRPRTNGPEAEARGYEAETEAKIGLEVSLASRL